MRAIRVFAALAAAALAAQGASAQQIGLGARRTDLQRHDIAINGYEVLQARVDIDPGVTSLKHWHPGEEIVYVLEGALEYAVEGRPSVTLKAGDVLFIPARTPHTAKNVGVGPGAELATYVVKKGEPLSTIVK